MCKKKGEIFQLYYNNVALIQFGQIMTFSELNYEVSISKIYKAYLKPVYTDQGVAQILSIHIK